MRRTKRRARRNPSEGKIDYVAWALGGTCLVAAGVALYQWTKRPADLPPLPPVPPPLGITATPGTVRAAPLSTSLPPMPAIYLPPT